MSTLSQLTAENAAEIAAAAAAAAQPAAAPLTHKPQMTLLLTVTVMRLGVSSNSTESN
jgi:hypothetical protein